MKQLDTDLKGNVPAIVGPVRFSYMSVYEPRLNTTRNEKEYSVVLLIPKDPNGFQKDPANEIKGLAGAIKTALLAKFGTAPPVWTNCMKDGDKEIDKNTGDPKYPGHWVISVRAGEKFPPALVDGKMNTVTEKDGWVSGDWGRAKLQFYGYDSAGNKGVSASLRSIQFLYKDEPFGSRSDPLEGFEAVEDAHVSTATNTAPGDEYDPFADE